MHSCSHILRPALLAVIGMISCAGAVSAEGKCFATWSEAAPIARRERLASIEQVNRLARDRASAHAAHTQKIK